MKNNIIKKGHQKGAQVMRSRGEVWLELLDFKTWLVQSLSPFIKSEGESRHASWPPYRLSPISVLFLTPLLSVFLSASDYIIKEKTVLLQKKDSEGFGFVLRGAKGKKCENKHKHPALQSHSVNVPQYPGYVLCMWTVYPSFRNLDKLPGIFRWS